MLTYNDNLESQELLAIDMNEENFDNIEIADYTEMTVEEHPTRKKFGCISKIKDKFSDYSSKINWIVFASICVFTMGSWLDICGKSRLNTKIQNIY